MKHIKLYESFIDGDSSTLSMELNSAMQNPEGSKPILLISSTETGITSMVSKEVNNLNGTLINVMADLINPEDMEITTSRGLVASDFLPQDNGKTGNGGVILFSDINRANRQVLNSIIKLATSRTIGNYVLPDKWVVIATSHGTSNGTDYSQALQDRFKIIQI